MRPSYAAAHVNLGNLLREQGDLDAAIDSYRKAIAADAGLVDAHNGLAFALQQRGRLAEAAESYRRALELQPDHANALCNLGALLNGFDRHEISPGVGGRSGTRCGALQPRRGADGTQ